VSFIYEQPRPAGRLTFAGGEADLGAIFDAAYESLQYVDNATARYEASERAYDERIRAIEAATGQRLENPLVAADAAFRRRFTDPDFFRPPHGGSLREWRSSRGLAKLVDEKSTAFTGRLAELAEKFPDAAKAIGADRPVAEDARAIARDAEQRLATLAGSRDGAGKWAAMLAGGGLASLRDPITVGSMVAGGGAGGARTLFGRILTVATKEALINAGSEALLQPSVQAWRREAGLDAGLDQAIRNIAFAGAFGGVLGAGGASLAEGGRFLLKPAQRDAVADALARQPDMPERTRQALSGNAQAAADLLSPVNEDLTPEARGALAAKARSDHADLARPETVNPEIHDRAISKAERAISHPEAEPFFADPDPDQVERIVGALAGKPEDTTTGEAGLVSFLIADGGVRDFRGELAAIGADQVNERFRGRLVKESGKPLDQAREAAAEAGYFNDLYGTPEEAVSQSTVRDLLDAIDGEMTTARDGAARAGDDAEHVRNLVDQVARYAGPGVSDDIIIRAAKLVNETGVDPFDAVESVFIAADDRAGKMPAANLPPGWSDAELEAASAARTGTPELDGPEPALNDPDDWLEAGDLAELDEDLEIPFGEGVESVKAVLADIERAETMKAVVEACRI